MTRVVLVAALAAVPFLAPAAQPMRPDARPASGTLSPQADRPAEALDLTARTGSQTGMDECPGFVDPSAPDVVVEWPGGDLRMTARSSFDATLAVSKPDGTWACNDDGEGLAPVVELSDAPRGRYAVWVGSLMDAPDDRAVTFLAGRAGPAPVADADARPSGGSFRARAGFEQESGPITRDVRAGGIDAVTTMGLVATDSEYGCNGFVDAAAPTTVVAYEGEGQGTLVLSATSSDVEAPSDLVLLVHTPAGEWRCNDDYGGSDPTVVVEGAREGDYAVWVGTFGGRARTATIAATLTVTETAPPPPDLMDMDFGDMEMDMGRVPFAEGTYMVLQPDARPAVRLVAGDVATEATTEVLPEGPNPVKGDACSGYVTASPTAAVELSGAGPLAISARAADGMDLVLLVQTPDGRWFCSDDADGLNPGVQIGSFAEPTAENGTYRVWAGTFGDLSMMDPMMEEAPVPPASPVSVTITASRGEIVVTEPDMGMDGMDSPDFTEGVYDGQDLQPDAPGQILTLASGAASASVTTGSGLINPVDGDACAGFIDARPTYSIAAEGGADLLFEAANDDDDLVMVVRTPSGRWLCSDDAGDSSNPTVLISAAEPGVHAVWVGTFSRRPGGVPATVSVAEGSAGAGQDMGE